MSSPIHNFPDHPPATTNNNASFRKEAILPATDARSPFFINLPRYETKPIDDLINFFKYWKYFIRSLIAYFKEISLVKEFEANINYQLISAIQFPGCKDLPNKILKDLTNNVASPSQSQSNTPTKELKRSLSGSSLMTMSSTSMFPAITPSKTNTTMINANSGNALNTSNGNSQSDLKRPGLFKTKSNNASFMKPSNLHKKTNSFSTTSNKGSPSFGPTTSTTTPPPTLPLANSISQFTNDIKIPDSFFPENSLFKNFPAVALSHHETSYINNSKLYKDLNLKLIPRLETLLKQVTNKIKEIKTSLKNDSFVNPELLKEISDTGKILDLYMTSIERYNHVKPVLKKKVVLESDKVEEDEENGVLDDPFLLKLQLDYQLKSQLLLENYMFASYVNLQGIAKDLFTYILKELSLIIDRFGKLNFNNEFYQFLKTKISNSSNLDWEYYISNNPSFLNIYKSTAVSPKMEIRNFKSVVIPYANSIHNKCLRFGILYRKSKILKNYTRYYYVLTCNYLHEFKFENTSPTGSGGGSGAAGKSTIKKFISHDDVPVKSYNLNDYVIRNKDEKGFKFQLVKGSNQSTKYSFKCLNENDFNRWINDFEELLKFGCKHLDRFNHVLKRVKEQDQPLSFAKPLPQQLPQSAQQQQPAIKGILNSSASSIRSTKLENSSSSLLNLPSSKQNSGVGLDGVFTPRIGTPKSIENNPFDQIFSSEMGTDSFKFSSNHSSLSSPSLTPNLSPNESTISFQAQPQSQSISQPIQHEAYLQIQQEFIRQQQEALNIKIKDLERQQAQLHNGSVSSSVSGSGQPSQSYTSQPLQQHHLQQQGSASPYGGGDYHKPLSSPPSLESMSSFVLNNENSLLTSKLINSNQNLLKRNMEFERPAVFSLNEENDESGGSTSSVPTVHVTSNH